MNQRSVACIGFMVLALCHAWTCVVRPKIPRLHVARVVPDLGRPSEGLAGLLERVAGEVAPVTTRGRRWRCERTDWGWTLRLE